MWEYVAMGESFTYFIPTNFNLDDMLKRKLFGQNNRVVVEGVLYDVFDSYFCPLSCNTNPKKLLERA